MLNHPRMVLQTERKWHRVNTQVFGKEGKRLEMIKWEVKIKEEFSFSFP